MAETTKNVKYVKVVKEGNGGAAGLVWCLGVIGAAVYYVGEANGFLEVIVALLKALVWPAFFVYEVLKFLAA
jgi:hypothetical protein